MYLILGKIVKVKYALKQFDITIVVAIIMQEVEIMAKELTALKVRGNLGEILE